MAVEVIPGAFTGGEVTASDWNGFPTVAWRGSDDEWIWYSQRVNVTNELWTPPVTIPGIASSIGAALAQRSDQGSDYLCALWKGANSDQGLWSTYLDPGTPDGGGDWLSQINVPDVGSAWQPALAGVGSTVYAAWRGMDTDQGQYWSSSPDGYAWNPQRVIEGAFSSNGPNITSYGGDLIAAWKGMDNDQSIWWSRLALTSGAVDWSPQQRVPVILSSEGPALAEWGNHVYAVWRGEAGDQRLWTTTFDGTSWAPQTLLNIVAGCRPAICVSGSDQLYVAASNPQDQTVWCALYEDLI